MDRFVDRLAERLSPRLRVGRHTFIGMMFLGAGLVAVIMGLMVILGDWWAVLADLLVVGYLLACWVVTRVYLLQVSPQGSEH